MWNAVSLCHDNERFARGTFPNVEPMGLRYEPGYAILQMKLMGTARLQHLAQCGTADLAGAVAALYAELKAIVWEGPDALLEFYPSAKIDGPRVEIALDETHCVALLVNYETGHMLVENAGPRVTRAKGEKRK